MTIAFQLWSRRGRTGKALLDVEDVDLTEERWVLGSKGYAVRGCGKGMLIHLHRVILERSLGRLLTKLEVTDHINRNPLDNRRSNLRVASVRQNSQNQGLRKTNRSGFKGVYFNTQMGKWHALIRVQPGKQTHLGVFENILDAALAYDRAAYTSFGDFALCNFPRFACGL